MDNTDVRAIFEETLKSVAPRLKVFSFSQDEESVRASIVINFEGPEVDSGAKGKQVIFGFGQMPLGDAGDWEIIRERLSEILTEEEQERYLPPHESEVVKPDPPPKKTKRTQKAKDDDLGEPSAPITEEE